jgi:drug/metabolite transporter (DMT)-like permease
MAHNHASPKRHNIGNQSKAYLYALMAVLFWSTIGSAFKITLNYVSFIQLVLFSAAISIIVLFILVVAQKKLPILRQVSRKDVLRSAGMGFLNPFLYYVILIKAYDILLAQEAVVLNYVWPMTLVLLSIPVLKQKIKLISILALLISFFGVVLITLQGEFTHLRFTSLSGVILALGSTVIWALFWLFNVKDHREEVTKLLLNFIFGFFYVLILAIAMKEVSIPNIRGIAGVTYIGIFEMGITYVIWLMALKLSVTTAKVSNLIFISPFLSLIFVSIFVGEKIMAYTIVGLVFILGGITLQRFVK